MKFLLLSCCAPCSCAVIKTLAERAEDFEVVFYNPNVVPLAEYHKRRDENRRICEVYDIPFVELPYNHETWNEVVQGLEQEPERGKRCEMCFYMRLKTVMEYAKERGITQVASVLGVSRWKDLAQVNRAGDKAAQETGVTYLQIEGRKGGMQELRCKLIQEMSLYNQKYCGCQFSALQQSGE